VQWELGLNAISEMIDTLESKGVLIICTAVESGHKSMVWLAVLVKPLWWWFLRIPLGIVSVSLLLMNWGI